MPLNTHFKMVINFKFGVSILPTSIWFVLGQFHWINQSTNIRPIYSFAFSEMIQKQCTQIESNKMTKTNKLSSYGMKKRNTKKSQLHIDGFDLSDD